MLNYFAQYLFNLSSKHLQLLPLSQTGYFCWIACTYGVTGATSSWGPCEIQSFVPCCQYSPGEVLQCQPRKCFHDPYCSVAVLKPDWGANPALEECCNFPPAFQPAKPHRGEFSHPALSSAAQVTHNGRNPKPVEDFYYESLAFFKSNYLKFSIWHWLKQDLELGVEIMFLVQIAWEQCLIP